MADLSYIFYNLIISYAYKIDFLDYIIIERNYLLRVLLCFLLLLMEILCIRIKNGY